MLIRYVLMFILFIPVGIYYYFFINRIAKRLKIDISSIVYKIFVLFICILIVVLCSNPYGVWIVIFVHLLVFSLITDMVFYLLKKKSKKNYGIYDSGIIPILLTCITLVYAYFNMTNVVLKEYNVYTKKTLNDNYKVVLISDLHFGTTMGIEKLESYSKKIELLNPDFIILAGDIVDENTSNKEMKEAFRILGNIKSKYGVFFIYGNHDKSRYNDNKNYTVDELKAAIDNSNIVSLVDDNYIINDEIILIGRDDVPYSNNVGRKSSEELISGLNQDKFLLVVDHRPLDIEKNESLGYDLQLSGHTHGGQIFPTGIFNEILKTNELNYGYKKINDFQVVVSSGMGGWDYPLRTGNNSEYVIINIIRE